MANKKDIVNNNNKVDVLLPETEKEIFFVEKILLKE